MDDAFYSNILDILRLDSEPEEKKKRIYSSTYCNICKKTLKYSGYYEDHCLSGTHIKKEKMYNLLQIDCEKEPVDKKRKLPEEYSNAACFLRTMKEKKINPSDMG